MSVEFIYHCDGPPNPDLPGDAAELDHCPSHVQTARQDGELPVGWIRLIWYGTPSVEEMYCGWSCVLRRAAQFPPPTIIEVTNE